MKHRLGVFLQGLVLSLLPLLILAQLQWGMPLIVMPILLLVGIVLFLIGTQLRES